MKKVLFYLQLALVLLCFFITYNTINNLSGKYILILALFPFSLFFAKIYKLSAIIFIFTAIFISILTFGFNHFTIIISLIFLSLIPVLYYFFKISAINSPILERRNNELKFYKEELLNEEKSLILKKENLEKKLERIMHFYLMSKDLTKNIAVDDCVNALYNILLLRTGVIHVVIAAVNKKTNSLAPISALDENNKQKWTDLLRNNSEIQHTVKPAVISSLFPIEEKPVVAWPIIIDNILVVCIFLVVEQSFSQIYLEEGEFFLPHLVLGTKRVRLFAELKEKSRRDGLTGLYLKRYFMEKLYSEIQRSKRYKTDFYIMMADIDLFKRVNDTYGHLIGDKVLIETSKVLKKSVRPGDIVGRYGGEEFIILMPMLSEEKVLDIAENIRKSTEKIKFSENNSQFYVTISIGIAKYNDKYNMEALINASDKALYEAKKTGRNKVIINK